MSVYVRERLREELWGVREGEEEGEDISEKVVVKNKVFLKGEGQSAILEMYI